MAVVFGKASYIGVKIKIPFKNSREDQWMAVIFSLTKVIPVTDLLCL